MKRIAAIVIGSNSTRLLVADACTELTNELRGRVETRLFLGMENHKLSEASMSFTAQSVAALKKQAEESDAQLLGIYATSATRDAENADDFANMIQEAARCPLSVLSGQQEAAYSFFGAAPDGNCGVIDIGGGSTEVVTGCGMETAHSYSLQLGASRLFKIQPINSLLEAAEAVSIAKEIVSGLPTALKEHKSVEKFYLIGGTGTSCARIAGINNERIALTRQHVEDTLRMIAETPREKRASIPGFPATRIDILPTGMAVLLAVMDELKVHSLHVTHRVNADGILREFVHKKFA